MSQIFISYAHEDAAVAKRFVRAFQDRGWTVWLDDETEVAAQLRAVVFQELKAARCVVVLWSRHSVNSNWVNKEAAKALKLGTLVPVSIEEGSEARGKFSKFRAAKLIQWQGNTADEEFERLVIAVEKLLNAPARGRSWKVAALMAIALVAISVIIYVWLRPKPPITARIREIYGRRPVTLHYQNGDLITILSDCTKQAGMALAPLPGLRASPMTIDATGTPLDEAVRDICHDICSWDYGGNFQKPLLLVSPNPQPAPATPAPSADRRP